MGLDALVYRNINTLKACYAADAFDVEPNTGEAMLKEGTNLKIPYSKIVALSCRLGNLDGIGQLRTKLSKLLNPQESLLLRKVLYNGTHAGDVIAPIHFDQFRAELTEVKKAPVDAHVVTFVNQMEELIKTAISENNPIVFT